MSWRRLFLLGAAAGVGFLTVFALFLAMSDGHQSTEAQGNAWDGGAIRASYQSAQLRQVDKANASLLIYYNLENTTDSDYQLADSKSVVIMCKMKDGSLNSEQQVRLAYASFLPAHQRTRVGLEVVHPFDWPSDSDPAARDKLRDFVGQLLVDVDAFVLFDQNAHRQIEFPKGWQDLPAAPPVKK